MEALNRIVSWLTRITKGLALCTIFVMMVFIFVAVSGRMFQHPVLGDVELVQLFMIVLIMFGLAYTQSEEAHISIGLLVDRFPGPIQWVMDLLAYLLTTIACGMISWIFVHAALKELKGHILRTDLLNIPFFPFKFIIAVGFALWGLQSLLKLFQAVSKLFKGESPVAREDKGELWQ